MTYAQVKKMSLAQLLELEQAYEAARKNGKNILTWPVADYMLYLKAEKLNAL